MAKAAVAAKGVPIAEGGAWRAGEAFPLQKFPAIVKPESGGSSVGFRILHSPREVCEIESDEPLLCEEYLPGREFSVGVLAGEALPPIELRPRGGTYDYAHKYTSGATEELCPAPISEAECRELQSLSLQAFSALGLRDYARVDFKADARGRVRFLEANTLPGMTATSLFPLAASVLGICFEELCEKMAAMAALRRTTS